MDFHLFSLLDITFLTVERGRKFGTKLNSFFQTKVAYSTERADIINWLKNEENREHWPDMDNIVALNHQN